MSVKDKLEIGLKPDAPYRHDNLPEHQQDDPDCAKGGEPGESPEHVKAREDCADGDPKSPKAQARRRKKAETR